MLTKIKYAYLKDQTWMYRRNYPRDVALLLGSGALKRSLKTSDPKVARARAAEINVEYGSTVDRIRQGIAEVPERGTRRQAEVVDTRSALDRLGATLGVDAGELRQVSFTSGKANKTVPPIAELARTYLIKRSSELRPGGFKSVRYSVDLFASKYGGLPVRKLSREEGREFLSLISELSTVVGKSEKTRGLGLDQLVVFSRQRGSQISLRTRKRIWAQVNHFLDWTVYEGHLDQNPFRTVLLEGKVKPAPYAVPTEQEVRKLLQYEDGPFRHLLLFCLLSGMRAGEAAGLLREDLVAKGNLGTFAWVRPNSVRELKTDASERLVPLHPELERVLHHLPGTGELFPDLSVNLVTKAFTKYRSRRHLERPGLVFHSTRKWFITQCERTGVPEHFTASIVGHKSARSENRLTYGIYSAGISDEQKRGIVDQIRLPEGCRT